MEIYLMQHGDAVPETEEKERPLSPEGVDQVRTAGRALRRLEIRPQIMLCSPKKRSRQSAALLAEAVNYPYSDIVRSEAVKAKGDPEEILELLRTFGDAQSVMIAGHLPSLARFASLLLGGDVSVALRFENGGLSRIDCENLTAGSGELVFHLPRKVLEGFSGDRKG